MKPVGGVRRKWGPGRQPDPLPPHVDCPRAQPRIPLVTTPPSPSETALRMPAMTRIASSAKEYNTVHPDQPAATSIPQARMFFWLPADGKRHAADILYKNAPSGKLITTLCGQQLTRPRGTNAEWLWPSCMECWSLAEEDVDPQT